METDGNLHQQTVSSEAKGSNWLQFFVYITIHMYSGITSGRVLNGELLYTKILEVNLFAFAYRLFHEDFSSVIGDFCIVCFLYIDRLFCLRADE